MSYQFLKQVNTQYIVTKDKKNHLLYALLRLLK
jgi:hypothetical protein